MSSMKSFGIHLSTIPQELIQIWVTKYMRKFYNTIWGIYYMSGYTSAGTVNLKSIISLTRTILLALAWNGKGKWKVCLDGKMYPYICSCSHAFSLRTFSHIVLIYFVAIVIENIWIIETKSRVVSWNISTILMITNLRGRSLCNISKLRL